MQLLGRSGQQTGQQEGSSHGQQWPEQHFVKGKGRKPKQQQMGQTQQPVDGWILVVHRKNLPKSRQVYLLVSPLF